MSRRHFFDDEELKRDIPNKIIYKFLLKYFAKNKRTFITLMGLLFLFTTLYSILPFFLREIIDVGLKPSNPNWEYIIQLITIWMLLFLFTNIGTLISNYFIGKLGIRIVYEVRKDLFAHMQNMSQSYFDKRHSGDIISVCTNDVDQLAMLFGGQLTQVIADGFRMILILGLMLSVNIELSIISVMMVPVVLLSSKLFRRKVKKIFKTVREKMGEVTQKTEENISGIKVIQAYGKEKQAEKEFDDVNRSTQKTMLKTRKIFSFYFPIIMFTSQFFSALILFYSGSSILNNGISIFGSTITFGDFYLFNSFLQQFFYPLFTLTMFQQVIEGALAASERIYILLHENVEIPDPENPKEVKDIKGNIEFRNVTFSYTSRGTQTIANSMPTHMSGMSDMSKMPESMKGMPDMSKMPPHVKEMMQNFMKNPDKMPPEMKERMQNFMKNQGKPGGMGGMGGMGNQMQGFQKMMNKPENILKMADQLDKKLKGQKGSGSMMGGGGGAMGSQGGSMGGGGGMGGRGGMPDGMVLSILGNPQIPEDVKEQFSATVKIAIEEHKKIQAHNQQKGEVIKKLNLKIPAGETIAIVGETGAGKTTLIKLLARFYEITQGEILIDGIDIKDVKKEDLRSIIGMVPQDAYLFSGDILSNIYYGSQNGDQKYELTDKVLEISKFLGLHNFIKNMPEGYNTYLLENASNLSVGQRQLIAFARVLMLDPRILILDEATSSVDPYTETLIQDALDKARKGRTTIIIAHRLSTIKNAGLIIVMDQGEIIEMGTHEELITKKGKYAQLVNMQSKDIN